MSNFIKWYYHLSMHNFHDFYISIISSSANLMMKCPEGLLGKVDVLSLRATGRIPTRTQPLPRCAQPDRCLKSEEATLSIQDERTLGRLSGGGDRGTDHPDLRGFRPSLPRA